MYVHEMHCDDCDGECHCLAPGDEIECNKCGICHPVSHAFIPGTPYLFCWYCIRTKKAFEADPG